MSYYANSQERDCLIAGLRDLAEFLDRHRDVPAPLSAVVWVFPPDGSNAEMFAGIDVIAGLIGSTPDNDSPPGHYSAVRNFGPVQYHAVAIRARDAESGKAE